MKQREQLSGFIDKESRNTEGDRLIGKTICPYIYERFQSHYYPNARYKLLYRLKFSWITSRSKHPKQFKTISNYPRHV